MLGLIGEGTGIAAKVLKSMGINLKEARIEVEKIIGRGSGALSIDYSHAGSHTSEIIVTYACALHLDDHPCASCPRWQLLGIVRGTSLYSPSANLLFVCRLRGC